MLISLSVRWCHVPLELPTFLVADSEQVNEPVSFGVINIH